MKIAVLGAGLQGTACVYDLLQNPAVTAIGVADTEKPRAEKLISSMQNFKKNAQTELSAHSLDVNAHQALVDFLKPFDVVISAVPYFLNLKVTQAAIAAQTHMVDMGGNTDLVFEQRKLSESAQKQGVTILPDCGLAPGMANIVATHLIQQFDTVDSVKIRVGGLPQSPKPPLNYQLFFSIHGLINEYMGKAVVLRNGQVTTVDTLTEVETFSMDTPVGDIEARELEAFHTLGGLSTLPWTYEGKINTLEYKTIRYPGHCHQIKTMADLGLLDETPVTVNGQTISPREAFAASVIPKLTFDDRRDIVLVIITAEGQKDGQPQRLHFELIDRYDPATQLTAMMRTTAFPVSIVAQMMGDGRIQERGVLALETAVPTAQFMDELQKRGFAMRVAENTCTPA